MKKDIIQTRNYDLFEDNEINRYLNTDTKNHAGLELSLTKTGWWSSKPLVVDPMRRGKHTIVEGHHRFRIAKRLGIPIWYTVEDKMIPIAVREAPGMGNPKWSLADWVYSHKKANKNPNYQIIWNYHERTKLPFTIIFKMFVSRAGKDTDVGTEVRGGTLRLNESRDPEAVEEIVLALSGQGVTYCRKESFVMPLFLLLRQKIVNKNELKRRLLMNVAVLKKKAYERDYMSIISEAYNLRQTIHVDLKTALRNAIALERKRLANMNREASREAGTSPGPGSKMSELKKGTKHAAEVTRHAAI